MAKSLINEKSYSFPRGPMPLGKAVEEAESAIQASYEADVEEVVASLKRKVDEDMIDESTSLDKELEKELSKHRRTISTRWAQMALMSSENADAAYDEDVEVPDEDGAPWTFLAYYAFRRDVIDGLDAAGVDIDGLGEGEGAPPDGEGAEDDDE
jgi:hypothetical protein